MLSAELHRENREASGEESYGRFLYNFFRDYDPQTGRYLEADPLRDVLAIVRATSAETPDLQLFAYAESNPIDMVDPRGLFVGKLIGGVLGRLVGATGEGLVVGAFADEAVSAFIASDAILSPANPCFCPDVSQQLFRAVQMASDLTTALLPVLIDKNPTVGLNVGTLLAAEGGLLFGANVGLAVNDYIACHYGTTIGDYIFERWFDE